MSFKHIALVLSLGLLFLVACSDTTPDPATGGNGTGEFEGTVDPASESFVIQTLEVPNPPGTPIRIELIGRFAPIFDAAGPILAGEIYLLVKVRNADYRTLYAPGEIVLSNFVPASVAPMSGNPDWTACTDTAGDSASVPPEDCIYGYDYSNLLGDGVLEPGESSQEKLWAFWDPDVVSFSFNARARFALEPDRSRIAGLFYSDENRNGVHDPGEPPFGGGFVHITGPDFERDVQVDENGRYSVAVQQPGLYTLWAAPPPTFAPVEPTTNNPLVVVLVMGPDGQVESFLHADFGWTNSLLPLVHPVQFAENRDQIPLDQYNLAMINLEEQILNLRAGFSGCSPDQPFQLYAVGGPQYAAGGSTQSPIPQVLLLLAHDDRGEECDAAFVRNLAYDLSPILEAYGPVVIVNFEAWNGEIHSFELYGPTPGSSTD